MNSYTAYKPSGIPHLGDVPEHWDVRRFKFFYREVDERSTTGSEELMSVSHKTGVTPRKQNVNMFLADSNVGYKVCRPEDIVINTMWAYMAALGVAKQEGLVSPSYGVYRPLQHINMNPDYVDHLLRIEEYRTAYLARSTGITDSRLRLYPESFLGIPLLFPPLTEQAAIVRYLDDADQRIRAYVRAKERLIALLEEERQAVIHQAVTRGIDPNVKLKPSGVEWLGNVPEHWSIRRLRSLANIKTGGQDTINRQDNGKYPFFVRSQTVERIDTWSYDGEAVLTAGDGAGVGKVFHYAKGKFDFHQRVYKFSNFRDVLGKFFFHYFKITLKNEVLQGTAKSTVDSLRLPMLQNFPVTIPPTPEQSAIVQHLEKVNTGIDAAIDHTRRQIQLMEEYRTRLIADVVTGKLDVREAATFEY